VLYLHIMRRQPIDQLVLLVLAIHAPNFSSIVRLSLSTPPLDGEWRGDPRTMQHSGHNILI
jgi:hypothetical protein